MKRKNKNSVCSAGRHVFVAALCWGMFFLGGSCKDDDAGNGSSYNPNVPVKVTNIAPDSGGIAKPVVITGENFGMDKGKIKLYFDDKEAVIVNAQNEHLYAVVPKLKGGEHTVRVVVDGTNEGVLDDKKFEYIVASSVTTVAGLGIKGEGSSKDDGDALEAKFYSPRHVNIDDQDNIIVTDGTYNVRLLSLTAGTVTTLLEAQDIYKGTFSNDYSYFYVPIRSSSRTRIAYEFYRDANWAQGLIVNTDDAFADRAGCMVVDDEGNKFILGSTTSSRIAKIDHEGNINDIGRIPSKYDWGFLVMAYNPLDKFIYVSSQYENIILRFDSRKETLTDADFEEWAGQFKVTGFYNGFRTEATFDGPWGMDFDEEGNLYIADQGNHAIRKIDTEGYVTTFAGTGKSGFKDGAIETAQFNNPSDVTVSPDGILYVADYYNYRIRCIAVQ